MGGSPRRGPWQATGWNPRRKHVKGKTMKNITTGLECSMTRGTLGNAQARSHDRITREVGDPFGRKGGNELIKALRPGKGVGFPKRVVMVVDCGRCWSALQAAPFRLGPLLSADRGTRRGDRLHAGMELNEIY